MLRRCLTTTLPIAPDGFGHLKTGSFLHLQPDAGGRTQHQYASATLHSNKLLF